MFMNIYLPNPSAPGRILHNSNVGLNSEFHFYKTEARLKNPDCSTIFS